MVSAVASSEILDASIATAEMADTAVTTAKIADNAVTTTLASALGHLEAGRAQVLLAPTMHGSMAHAVLRESLARLANLGCVVIPPLGRDGKALLPDDATLVDAVARSLGR